MNRERPILLVEDDANDRELIIESLKEKQLSSPLDVVCDGEEALDYLNKSGSFINRDSENPAVVLLDIKMPKVDGFEVLEKIRKNDSLKLVPVVILTSSREYQDIIRSYNLGANAYVAKPVKFDDFFRVVTELGIFWTTMNIAP
ncbi:MAG: response regulator [bacterium]|nr:response regulator [bacterium]